MVTVNINQPCADRLNGAGVELTATLADDATAVQIGGYARSTGIPCQAPVVKGRKRCKMRGKLSLVLRRQRVGSASARPRGYAGRQPSEGVIQITADNANLWFYGSYQRELSENALTHIGEALAESLWSLRFHKDIAMRFEIQKDLISGQWCVLDCYASNRNVSSHKLKSVAILAKLQYEQMWDNYKIENGIAA